MITEDVRLGNNVLIPHSELVNLYGCEIGDGCKIASFVEIQRGVKIGKNVKIEAFAFIPTGVTIEDNVFIGPHVCFTNDKNPRATNTDGSLLTPEQWTITPTIVKQGASIGANSTVVCGVTIYEYAMIGAGSVVTKDVGPWVVAYGNPAKKVKKIFNPTRILILNRERTGSTFLMSLLLGRNGAFIKQNGMFGTEEKSDFISYPEWINLKSKERCAFWHESWAGYSGKNLIENLIYKRHDILDHEMYSWSPPADLSRNFFNNLPEANWKFIYLLRDPRNRIESLCKRGAGNNIEIRKTIFENETKMAKIELSSLPDLLNDSRLYLLKFEEFIKNPVDVFNKIIQFCGFEIDIDFYKKVSDNQMSCINSSFGDGGVGSDNRWQNWTKEEKIYFKEQCGDLLVKFGYENSLDW